MNPSTLWNGASAATLATVGVLCRAFLLGTQRKYEVEGLEQFLEFMEERKTKPRMGGLVTVSNHTSVMDDPLMWGALPIRHVFNPASMRWGLGSHDICFTSRARSLLFSLGQVLPTHRLHKSPTGLGGLFQPALDESVRLLSHPTQPQWVHIFPEGRVHQHPAYQMRYFKWGVSRCILEPPTTPFVIPIFIEGFSDIMHESREFPRFLPRVGKNVKVAFGKPVDAARWEDVRGEWGKLCEVHGFGKSGVGDSQNMPQEMKLGEDAVRLRIETTARVREEVAKLRRELGWPEEEPTAKLVETYKKAGMTKDGKTVEGAWEKDI
ncbi:putative taz protein [Tirmania nivea]|nr:putative taz protein [Tirmania nivea]